MHTLVRATRACVSQPGPDPVSRAQARGTELVQLHRDMAVMAPRLTAAVQACQEWQARHEQASEQLQQSQGRLAGVQKSLDAQTAEGQQLGSLLSVKQKEVQQVRSWPCCGALTATTAAVSSCARILALLGATALCTDHPCNGRWL